MPFCDMIANISGLEQAIVDLKTVKTGPGGHRAGLCHAF